MEKLNNMFSYITTDRKCIHRLDEVLSSDVIENLDKLILEKKFLLESDKLREKLVKLKDKLNFVFKEIDALGLPHEYN